MTQISPKTPPVILLQPFQQVFHRNQTPMQNSGNLQVPASKITGKNNPYSAADSESTWPVWGFPAQLKSCPMQGSSVPLEHPCSTQQGIEQLPLHI